jgi:hypothetical protein
MDQGEIDVLAFVRHKLDLMRPPYVNRKFFEYYNIKRVLSDKCDHKSADGLPYLEPHPHNVELYGTYYICKLCGTRV